MARTNEPAPHLALAALEKRAAAIILKGVNDGKTEQDIWKALKEGDVDVRRLQSDFVTTKIEEDLKAARLAANASRPRRKKKPPE